MTRWIALALALGALVVGILSWRGRETVYPLLPDTAAYLEMARSYTAEGRFEVVPYGLEHPEVAREQTRLWPAGYPVAIAMLSWSGIRDVDAALWVNRGSFVLIPLLILLAFHRLLTPVRALTAAMLALTAPSAMVVLPFAASEGLCVACIVAAIGFALREERWMLLVCSGICAGLAYTIRNPAIGIAVAIPLWITWEHRHRPGEAVRRLVLWGTGALLAVMPMVVHNLRQFGALQPYATPPSTSSLLQNLQLLVGAMSGDLVGWLAVDRVMRSLPGVVLALAVAIVLLVWCWRARAGDARSRAVRLLVLTVGVMAAVLVTAATRFSMPALSDHRFVALMMWAVWVGAALCVPSDRRATGGVVLIVALLFVARGYDVLRREARRPRALMGALAVARDTALFDWLRSGARAPREFVASNAAWVLRAEARTSTRQLVRCADDAGQIGTLRAIADGGRPVTVILTPTLTGIPCESGWGAALTKAGFRPAHRTVYSTIFRREAPPASP